jgi:hypothetical protein
MTDPEINEADVLEQQRTLSDDDQEVVPSTIDTEADPADVSEQSRPVPSEEEDRRDG